MKIHAFISRTENMVVLKFYCQENMTYMYFKLAIFLNSKFKCTQNIREVQYFNVHVHLPFFISAVCLRR